MTNKLVIIDDMSEVWDPGITVDMGFTGKSFAMVKGETMNGLGIHVIWQGGLEKQMMGLLQRRMFAEPGLAIFPGRSAQAMMRQDYWKCEYCGWDFPFPLVAAHAERKLDAFRNPIVTAGEVLPSRSVCPEIKTVLVVDDVVSSGLTLRKLAERNRHKFPQAIWYACTLISRLEKVKGYEEVISVLYVPPDEHGKKTPINSLSTLQQDGEIQRAYATRYFKNPSKFIGLLSDLYRSYEMSRTA
ncbi:MAG: hypothetical protein Q7S86_01490 [bacterium]|nr:hypothetical protein [bacterium]